MERVPLDEKLYNLIYEVNMDVYKNHEKAVYYLDLHKNRGITQNALNLFTAYHEKFLGGSENGTTTK